MVNAMTAGSPPLTGGRRGRTVFNVVFAATVGQLLLATLAPHLPQFEGKAFGARLLVYPLMMRLPPVIWIGVARRRGTRRRRRLELGEWYSSIRHSSELSTAYEDRLGDEALGSLGGLAAALLLVGWRTRHPAVLPE